MKILKPLINELVKIVKEGHDLGKKELPLIAKELLRYSYWSNLMAAIFQGATSLVILWGGVCLTLKAMAGNIYDWAPVILVLVPLALGLATTCIVAVQTLMKIKMAPRVFLLETLKEYLD